MNIQNDPTQRALVSLLDATALRHRVLSGNLANVDTPGYIRKDVNFEDQLAEAVKSGTLSEFNPQVTTDLSAMARADGNNVAIDNELSEINKNALLHQMAIQLLQSKLAMQRAAILGRA
jgi:flagellar basal-body rod protein FlgB